MFDYWMGSRPPEVAHDDPLPKRYVKCSKIDYLCPYGKVYKSESGRCSYIRKCMLEHDEVLREKYILNQAKLLRREKMTSKDWTFLVADDGIRDSWSMILEGRSVGKK